MPPLLIPSIYRWKTIQVVACAFHGSAIVATIFRLAYRWYTSRFWWEDTWAAISLAFDIICLAVISWGHFDDPRIFTLMFWVLPFAFTCVLWAARMSIIYSILRVANPQGVLRWIVYGIITSFAIMWIALVVGKVLHCKYNQCNMGPGVAIALLITDTISDLMLVIMPIYLLQDIGLTHHQRILVISAFCASLLITVIAIPLSVSLFVNSISDTTLILGHVKSSTSLIVANLLVIVSFVYRYGSRADLDQPAAEFTTIIELTGTMDRGQSMANSASTGTDDMTLIQEESVFEEVGKST